MNNIIEWVYAVILAIAFTAFLLTAIGAVATFFNIGRDIGAIRKIMENNLDESRTKEAEDA